jgi:Uncharacterized conserved protein
MERDILLRTKSIHAPISPEDGYRISIMSRHTLNDGVTVDPRITAGIFDEWIKELAPPDTLIGTYYKRGLPWEEFEKQYLEFLREPKKQSRVKQLIELAKTRDITLLCVENTPEHCHRRLLAEECQRLEPKIRIILT